MFCDVEFFNYCRKLLSSAISAVLNIFASCSKGCKMCS